MNNVWWSLDDDRISAIQKASELQECSRIDRGNNICYVYERVIMDPVQDMSGFLQYLENEECVVKKKHREIEIC